MPNTGLAIELQPAERTQLEQWESAHGTPQQVALRCRIILRAVAGQQNVAIAEGLRVSRPTVQLWRKRVHQQGIGEVWEIAPGRGRKAHYDQGQRDRIIQPTLQSKPKGMTHWSCRLMAKAQGVSKNTVNRLWQLHNIKPHLSRTFKLSRDAKFLEKLSDVVGLYMNPPDKALVLCVDEKSQIQARNCSLRCSLIFVFPRLAQKTQKFALDEHLFRRKPSIYSVSGLATKLPNTPSASSLRGPGSP